MCGFGLVLLLGFVCVFGVVGGLRGGHELVDLWFRGVYFWVGFGF